MIASVYVSSKSLGFYLPLFPSSLSSRSHQVPLDGSATIVDGVPSADDAVLVTSFLGLSGLASDQRCALGFLCLVISGGAPVSSCMSWEPHHAYYFHSSLSSRGTLSACFMHPQVHAASLGSGPSGPSEPRGGCVPVGRPVCCAQRASAVSA
jgi:hypothetical protein